MIIEADILLADRSSSVREYLKRTLEALGYRVITAGNGGETMTMLNGPACPRLLIMDLDLPLAHGIVTLQKAHNRIPALPVLVYSSFTELRDHPAVACAEAFLEKGEDPSELAELVEKLLRN